MVREHGVDVLVVLPAERGVAAVDLAGEQRHAFVLHGRPVERDEFKMEEIRRLDELGQDQLTLRYGPFLRYQIPLREIRTVRRRTLSLTIWSTVRFPGIALFTVPYADVGNVKMCATAALNNILLIATEKEKYGITPADEEVFVAALSAQMEG